MRDREIAVSYLTEAATELQDPLETSGSNQLGAHIKVLLTHVEAFEGALSDARGLAMLALQSDRYRNDPEYRQAVDDVLAVTEAL